MIGTRKFALDDPPPTPEPPAPLPATKPEPKPQERLEAFIEWRQRPVTQATYYPVTSTAPLEFILSFRCRQCANMHLESNRSAENPNICQGCADDNFEAQDL